MCTAQARTAHEHDRTHIPPGLSLEALDRLLVALEVQVIALSEYVVGPSRVRELGGLGSPSFRYIKDGHGNLHTSGESGVGIGPHMLIVVPPGCAFRFEPATPAGTVMFCGIFRSLLGNSIDLFDTLEVPVIEQFSKDDGLEPGLQDALAELAAGNVCSDVLVSIAVKQVIVALIRRSLRTMNGWTRRLAVLAAAEHEFGRAQVNSGQG